MTAPQILYQPPRLRYRCDSSGLDERRELTDKDTKLFDEWIEAYRKAVLLKNNRELFLSLGQDMYGWLNHDAGYLERMYKSVPPWIVELCVSENPGSEELRFLETPWEVLADTSGLLAARLHLAYCPLRRIGKRGQPSNPVPYRLSMVFMAAAPRGSVPLAYEAEENAIIDAAVKMGMDMVVEESGSLEYLVPCMVQESPVDVLHISCHGTSDPVPLLALEDDEGNPSPSSPLDMAQKLGSANRPKLLFLSACQSSDPDRLLNSYASEMIRWGVPSVLGWGESVSDPEATRFASLLYEKLCQAEPIDKAVAMSRFALLNPKPNDPRSRDWHLARLYLGQGGGGVLAKGKRSRKPSHMGEAKKAFLDEKGRAVPVAGPGEFVGRRHQIQQILRVLRGSDYVGVLIHGMGRQGKSSLAARAAHRLHAYKPIVIYGQYDASFILETVLDALETPQIRDNIAPYRQSIKDNPSDLRPALRAIVELSEKPFLLIIDDFERALVPSGESRHQVKPHLLEGIRAVLSAFSPSQSPSRVLFTSRYAFTLPHPRTGRDLADELFSLSLAPMEPYESKKQAAAKVRRDPVRQRRQNAWRTDRCIHAAMGNPGLQDLLFSLSLDAPEAADQALDQMEGYISGGLSPSQENLLEFLKNLTLEKMLDLLKPEEKELLRGSTLFSAPVPLETMKVMAEAMSLPYGSGFGLRLFGLGLWEWFEDPFDYHTAAVAVNALVRPKAGTLTKKQSIDLAERAAPDLYNRWGKKMSLARVSAAAYEMTHLSLLAKNHDILAATAAPGVQWLESQHRFKDAANLGRMAVEVLNDSGTPPSAELLRVTAEMLHSVGENKAAAPLFEQAVSALRKALKENAAEVQEDLASTLLSYSRLLTHGGNLSESLTLLSEAFELFQSDRERAIVAGDIARIKVDKGEVDEALRLQTERLRVNNGLGDVDGMAAALWDISQIELQKDAVQEGLQHLNESYTLFVKIGRVDSISIVGMTWGAILCHLGDKEQGLAVLRLSRDGFLKLGMTAMAQQAEELIQQYQ